MKSQTTLEAMLVLTAYLAFLTALVSVQGSLLKESRQVAFEMLNVLEQRHACAFLPLFSNDGRNSLTEFQRITVVNCTALSRASNAFGVEQNAFESV